MKAGLLMGLESRSSRAEQLARHILAYGRPLTVEELVARIDAVSVESTRDAARGVIGAQQPGHCRARQRQGSGHGGSFCGRIDQVEGQGALALRVSARRPFQGISGHRGLGGVSAMALFRLPSSGSPALAPRGNGLLLRAPQMADFLQWAHLREYSRNYLTPWEPIWPSDDLTRSGFRLCPRRYAEDIAADHSFPTPSSCFANPTAR